VNVPSPSAYGATRDMGRGPCAGGVGHADADSRRRRPDLNEAWTWLLVLTSLVLPIWCCFHRANSDRCSTVDVFQPGAVLAILLYVYTVVPAFHVWHDLGYDWTVAWGMSPAQAEEPWPARTVTSQFLPHV
jgi:hypothetical protein